MICSSQLKEHVRNAKDLSLTLEEDECTYDCLKVMCKADQKFAVMVADGMVLLKDVILRLKEEDAKALFPNNVPFLESGTSPEQALLEVAQIDWEAVNKTRTDTELLMVVSTAFDNRSDLIEKKILFLSELLKDLKKDDALLRSHEVEISFSFSPAGWTTQPSSSTSSPSLTMLLGLVGLMNTNRRSRR